MSEEPKAPWLNYLALTTVVLAVCATLSTFKGATAANLSLMSQTMASDQWALFQSKSLKLSLGEMSQAQLELARMTMGAEIRPGVKAAYDARLRDARFKVAKYEVEKDAIQVKAEELELRRDLAQKHGQGFAVAVIFLQISILLSSIAALMKLKLVWILSMVVGGLGVLSFANGFLLLF